MLFNKRLCIPIASSLAFFFVSDSLARTTWIPISNGGVSSVIPLIPNGQFQAPSNIKKSKVNGDIVLTWDDIQHASRYQIQGQDKNGNWVNVVIVSSNSLKINSIFDGYSRIRIIACNYNSCINTGVASINFGIKKNTIFIHTDLLGSPVAETGG